MPASSPDGSPRRGRRRIVVAAAGAAVIAVVAAGAVVAVTSRPGSAETATTTTPLATTPVTTADIVSETVVAGTVQYSDSQAVVAGLAGTVTQMPAVGDTVGFGGVLYRVNTQPVVLLPGTAPMWRDLTTGVSAGDDVRQLQDALRGGGFLASAADGAFGAETAGAVRRWQKSLGVAETGQVSRGAVLFAAHPLRVDSLQARLGAEVGPGTPLYTGTSPDVVATVDVTSDDRGLAVAGAPVTVTLLDGSTIDGAVSAVGSPTQRPATSSKPASVVIPVVVSVTDQAALAPLALATVRVTFSSSLDESALTVPVEALIPLSDTEFAVQTPAPSQADGVQDIPVTLGRFGSGRVEISGDGIRSGLPVVVPAS